MALIKSNLNSSIKTSCPYHRRCFTDGSVCGSIGYYFECPISFDRKTYVVEREDKETSTTSNISQSGGEVKNITHHFQIIT